MTGQFSPADDAALREVYDLADALLSREISETDSARLARLVSEDAEARRHYIRFMHDSALLGEWGRDAAGVARAASTPPDNDFNPQPIVLDLSSPSDASAPFVGGWAFSYMVASVFVCLLLLGFWLYKVSPNRSWYLADGTNSTGNQLSSDYNSRGLTDPGESSHDRSAMVFVGRVTGMAGAKWSDEPNYIVPLGVRVALGRTYKLKAGLMEITYDTGAKVILEGPCDYEVDSTAGGYLALGKLVARVGAGSEGREAGEAASGQWPVASMKNEGGRMKDEALLATRHSPLATNPTPHAPRPTPLFAVRTPTALVIDLGTEFGVEVSDSGETASHVFLGSVKVQTVGGDDGRRHQNIVLRENESARVEQGDNQVIEVRKTAVNPDTFARRMPDPPPVIFLHDNFENQVDSTTFGEAGEYGLNECLSTRQSGVYRRIPYYRGGDFSRAPCTTQVNHALCPGKLNLIADHGQAGWVSLNCNFPCDVEVSVELEPNALRCADKSPLPKTVQGDPDGESWMALGIRGQNYQLDHRELPLASNAGAAIQVHANGRWSCFENGKPIAEGRVAPARPYRVTIRAVHDRLEIWINGSALNLDPVGGGPVRTLTGRLAEPKDNYISIGACNMDGELPSDGPMLNSADNLIVRSARPCPDEPEPQQKGEPPPNSP